MLLRHGLNIRAPTVPWRLPASLSWWLGLRGDLLELDAASRATQLLAPRSQKAEYELVGEASSSSSPWRQEQH